MLLRPRFIFIPPALPSRAERPPSGLGWIHEIKHDGFRLMVRRDAAGVRLLTRNGHDWSARYRQISQAASALGVRSFLIDGEAVACDGHGMPSFDRLRYRRADGAVFLFAFDLLEMLRAGLASRADRGAQAQARQAAAQCAARLAA
jgi:bifunctional non-homologous end joining protein LigD